jgi:hypothetical protein
MSNISKLCVISAVVLLGFLVLPHQAPAAPDGAREQTVECCHPLEKSPPTGIGGRINAFLAFGCCLNYRLTNWILDEKCDTQPNPCDFSRDKSLCE